MVTPVFERMTAQRDELEPLCLSLVFAKRTLDLQAASRADRDLWLRRHAAPVLLRDSAHSLTPRAGFRIC
jgi:hypothetical protein